MDLIKKKLNQYLIDLIEKETLTPEEYMILVFEYDRRKAESEKKSDDTIMRIFKTLS